MTNAQKKARLKRLWDDRFPHLPDADTMMALVFLAEGERVLYSAEAEWFTVTVAGRSYRVEFAQFDALSERGWIEGDGETLCATAQGRYWVKKFLRETDTRLRAKSA